MAKSNGKQRQRGVRASRAKLARALTVAGLKTQAALAERIADLENLDTAPKDVVNRVFRELPVELITLERVARALNVEAHTLYKTADEKSGTARQPERTAPGRNLPGWGIPAAVALSALVAALLIYSRPGADPSAPGSTEVGENVDDRATLDLGSTPLVVMSFDGDEDDAFGHELRGSLGAYFAVASPTATALTRGLDPKSAAERLRADAVVNGDIVTVGRLSAVRVYLYANGIRTQIWAESWPVRTYPEKYASVAKNVSSAIRVATGLPTVAGSGRHFPLAPVQDDYLEGELHTDRPSSELNIKRAQSRFEAALRRDPNYARAHAGLCQTLLEEHWMTDEERALNDAATACGQAVQLDAGDPVVAAARAHFLRRTGRNDEAIALYEEIVDAHPYDSSALYGLANSRLAEFRQNAERQVLLDAKQAARAAAEADRNVWKPLFALASMEWFDGNLQGAIDVAEEALDRDENEKIMTNLGTFYTCAGEFESARDTYLRARKINPATYVGDEFLGQIYYFLGDYEQSAELRQRAIDSFATGEPEIHEMWGSLGDSYRHLEKTAQAIDAYRQAATIAERDYLRGTSPSADRVARAYYYIMLDSLDSSAVPAKVLRDIDEEIEDIASQETTSIAYRRLAVIYLERGELGKARDALTKATASCPGYAKMADFSRLGTTALN